MASKSGNDNPLPAGDPSAEPGAQPHPSDEPPIPDADELPGTPRPSKTAPAAAQGSAAP